MVIETVTGLSCEQFLRQDILAPLGLASTGHDHHRDILVGRVSGYAYADGQFANAEFLEMGPAFADGGMYSTVGDLHRWMRAVVEHRAMSESSVRATHSPRKLSNGTQANYGFGWGIKQVRGLRTIRHAGGINGFGAFVQYIPDLDATTVVLTNSPRIDAPDMAGRITDIYFGESMDPVR
jgi:CubicO group peptidase (beta-lactamase class C family)